MGQGPHHDRFGEPGPGRRGRGRYESCRGLHPCLKRGTSSVKMPCCRGGYPRRGDSWGPTGRMQGDGRPHFMRHRGGFQGMPQPQPHPGETLEHPPWPSMHADLQPRLFAKHVRNLSCSLMQHCGNGHHPLRDVQAEEAGRERNLTWGGFHSMESSQMDRHSHITTRRTSVACPCQTCHRCLHQWLIRP